MAGQSSGGAIPGLEVLSISTGLPGVRPIISETERCVRYHPQMFRATATIEVKADFSENHWYIGWVQGCSDLRISCSYTNNESTCWLHPPLEDGMYRMINDSDGSASPYHSSSEVKRIDHRKDITYVVEVTTVKEMEVQAAWDSLQGEPESLQHISHLERYYTWLVAYNSASQDVIPLKTIRWTRHLEIHVLATGNLGDRTCIVGAGLQRDPVVLKTAVDIPQNVLQSPMTNQTRCLMWYPGDDSRAAREIIPALQSAPSPEPPLSDADYEENVYRNFLSGRI